jgi:hypothetical protein
MGYLDEVWPQRRREAARKELRRWATVHARRDEVIREAAAAGIDYRSIQEITGVARTTIARIVGPGTRYRRPEPSPLASRRGGTGSGAGQEAAGG